MEMFCLGAASLRLFQSLPVFDDPEVCQAVILDHFRKPRREGKCPDETHGHVIDNPLSGVELALSLTVSADGMITCARFDGGGCAVSTASADLMVGLLENKSLDDARLLVGNYRAMMLGESEPDGLGNLEALKMVRAAPDRLQSALLVADCFAAAV